MVNVALNHAVTAAPTVRNPKPDSRHSANEQSVDVFHARGCGPWWTRYIDVDTPSSKFSDIARLLKNLLTTIEEFDPTSGNVMVSHQLTIRGIQSWSSGRFETVDSVADSKFCIDSTLIGQQRFLL